MSRDDYLERAWWRGKKASTKEETRIQEKDGLVLEKVIQWRIEHLSLNKMYIFSLSFSFSFSLSTAVVYVVMF